MLIFCVLTSWWDQSSSDGVAERESSAGCEECLEEGSIFNFVSKHEYLESNVGSNGKLYNNKNNA